MHAPNYKSYCEYNLVALNFMIEEVGPNFTRLHSFICHEQEKSGTGNRTGYAVVRTQEERAETGEEKLLLKELIFTSVHHLSEWEKIASAELFHLALTSKVDELGIVIAKYLRDSLPFLIACNNIPKTVETMSLIGKIKANAPTGNLIVFIFKKCIYRLFFEHTSELRSLQSLCIPDLQSFLNPVKAALLLRMQFPSGKMTDTGNGLFQSSLLSPKAILGPLPAAENESDPQPTCYRYDKAFAQTSTDKADVPTQLKKSKALHDRNGSCLSSATSDRSFDLSISHPLQQNENGSLSFFGSAESTDTDSNFNWDSIAVPIVFCDPSSKKRRPRFANTINFIRKIFKKIISELCHDSRTHRTPSDNRLNKTDPCLKKSYIELSSINFSFSDLTYQNSFSEGFFNRKQGPHHHDTPS